MSSSKIQQIFSNGWDDYCRKYQPSSEQSNAAYCIMNCKSGAFGYNISLCEECSCLDFHAKDYKTGRQKVVAISCVEFIRRFMMHVLPCGFQKIRYYGFLNNRWKSTNLAIIFRIQGHRRFQSWLSDLTMDEILLKVWNYNIRTCPACGCCNSMRPSGRTYAMRN